MMWGNDYSGGMAWSMVLVGVLVIASLVALVVFVVRQAGGPQSSASNARGVLAERFARGEIDEAEFQRRSATLSSHTGHA